MSECVSEIGVYCEEEFATDDWWLPNTEFGHLRGSSGWMGSICVASFNDSQKSVGHVLYLRVGEVPCTVNGVRCPAAQCNVSVKLPLFKWLIVLALGSHMNTPDKLDRHL